MLHIVIEGRRVAGRAGDACTAAPLPTGRTPDGRWPGDLAGKLLLDQAHKPLIDMGVDGWWLPDQGDGPRQRFASGAEQDVLRRPTDLTGQTSKRLRCTAMATRHAAVRLFPCGRRRHPMPMGDSEVPCPSNAVNTGLSGIPGIGALYIGEASFQPRSSRASCMCKDGSSSRRSILCSGRMGAIGDCDSRGAGIRAASRYQAGFLATILDPEGTT